MAYEQVLCNSVSLPKRIKYNQVDDSIIIGSNLLSTSYCDRIVAICEEHNEWENDDSAVYLQATYDLEVEKCPKLVDFLRAINLIEILNQYFELHYGMSINSFDDVFVVKYQAYGEKSELVEHTDAGDLSFMIALTDRNMDFDGGGTYFRLLDSVLHLDKGDVVTFDAKLYHRGVSITRGTRYLLVGFCHMDRLQQLIEPEIPTTATATATTMRSQGTPSTRGARSTRGNLSTSLELLY